MKWQAQARLGGLAVGSFLVLTRCPPDLGELSTGLRSPWRWVAEVGPDAAASTLAGALLWLVALWVALALTVTAAALLPGRFGRLGRLAAYRLTPVALRRVVAAATSTSILLSPAAALASPTGGSTPAPAGTSAVLPAVGWPTDPAPAAGRADPASTAGASNADTSNASTARNATSTDRITVRPGDSLWSIAASRLGAGTPAARIRQEWPRWYTANRRLIGPDPNLIRPGTSLRVPGTGLLAPTTPATDTAGTDTDR